VAEQGDVRYAKHGDSHLAYRVWGEGPPVVWLPSQFIPILAMDEEPAYERFLSRLASFSTLIAFDRLGIGSSDPIHPDRPPSIGEWVTELLSVLDAAAVDRAYLVAHLGGGMTAVRAAAEHPDRVSGIVMALAVGNFGAIARDPDMLARVISSAQPEYTSKQETEVNFLSEMAPSRVDDPRFRSWWDAAGRRGASPAVARTYLEVHARSDVSPFVGQVTAPTLVITRPDHRPIYVQGDHRFGLAIPGARHVEVPGIDALPWLPDSEAIVAEVEDFVTGARRPAEATRTLLTVMFTDVVGSTERAARMGDDGWRDLLETHDRVMRQELARHDGREVDTAGDGFLTTFATPTQAVKCAARLHRAMAEIGLQLRVGIHCGEVEIRGQNIAGIAVHIAARVQSKAEPAQTFVTSTVKEVMAGSGLAFETRGMHVLKGVPDEWSLFAVT
jgi:class 3 adenylate cyclase